MAIQLDPSELGFRRPFNHEVTQLLRLKNPSSDPIAFKVKTTAPKQYCVRPNSGRIEADSEVEVQVLLQAMREDPPPEARCRDKFLVQSIAITPDRELSNIAAIWQNAEKLLKGEIQERKIRVVFLPADGSTITPSHNILNGTHITDEAPPAYGSPAPSFGSPAPDAATPINRSADPSVSASRFEPRSDGREDSANAQEPARSIVSNVQSALGGAAASVTNAVPTSGEDLSAQLAEAKATISKLKQQAEEQVLRQRESDAIKKDAQERITTGTTGTDLQQQQSQPIDGVPVQIAAALCLLSFLLAYFFF